MSYNKETVTKAVLQNLPNSAYHSLPVDKVIFLWFVGGRSGSNWQLKQEGEDCFQHAEIEYYDFDLFPQGVKKIKGTDAKNILKNLQKKITSPYFLSVKIDNQKPKIPFVRVYDNKLAMMISLYGNVTDFIGSDITL